MTMHYNSMEEFVKAYMEVHKSGGSFQDVANKIGKTRQSVEQRSVRLRLKGVNLPYLKEGKNITIQEINKLIESYDS